MSCVLHLFFLAFCLAFCVHCSQVALSCPADLPMDSSRDVVEKVTHRIMSCVGKKKKRFSFLPYPARSSLDALTAP